MSTKNANKTEAKHKATDKRTQCKEIGIQTYMLIVTNVQRAHKNMKELYFIQIAPFS